jgi:hypothetical protein
MSGRTNRDRGPENIVPGHTQLLPSIGQNGRLEAAGLVIEPRHHSFRRLAVEDLVWRERCSEKGFEQAAATN